MRKYYKFIRFNGKLKYLGFEMKLFLYREVNSTQ